MSLSMAMVKADIPTWGGDTPTLARGYLKRSLKKVSPYTGDPLQPRSSEPSCADKVLIINSGRLLYDYICDRVYYLFWLLKVERYLCWMKKKVSVGYSFANLFNLKGFL